MPFRPVKSLNGKKLSGALATPIETGLFMPLTKDSLDWQQYLADRDKEMRRQSMAKMPALAAHLGIDVEKFDLSPKNGFGWMMLYGVIAEKLAAELIPGFQERPRGKNPREVTRFMRLAVDAAKIMTGESDLDLCRDLLKQGDADLRRPTNRTTLEKRSRSLANLISKDRSHKKSN